MNRMWKEECLVAFSLLIITSIASHAQGFPGDPVKGKSVYQHFCLRCHGEALDGNGPEAASLSVPPANFHAAHSRIKDEMELRLTIERGRARTAMHAWDNNLRDDQIRDVAAYIRSVVPHETP